MFGQPRQEHHWLDQLVGEWDVDTEAITEPGKPPVTFSSTESVRSLGGLWVLCEGRGEMPEGGTSTMLMSLGYDPEGAQYVGTFIASMMTHLWIYRGSLDESGTRLVLDTEGPSPMGGAHAKYQDTLEVTGPDRRVLTSRVLGADGTWQHFMRSTYRRRSAS